MDLIDDGRNVLVSRSSRLLFVQRFVQHALYESVATDIQQFLSGLKMFFSGPVLDMCSILEVDVKLQK